jgi:IclR family KDG regulon transcriptional repressor
MSNVAVERALILLRYIVDNEDGLSIREASRNLGYSPATVQKLIAALKTQGYVVQDELTERYHLGPEAVQLGLSALSRLEVLRVARPQMESLSEASGETVFLAIPRADHVIYVDKIVSFQPIRMDAPIGAIRPYNCTSVGKVLLADMPDERIRSLAERGVFEKRTERSKIEVDDLLAELKIIRNQGWAQDDEEFIPGAACIGAPIYNHLGQAIACITVSGPAERINKDIEHFVSQVKERAQLISGLLGYRNLSPRVRERILEAAVES